MEKLSSAKKLWQNNWIMLLIIAQPLLDIMAYWTQSPDGTAAGLIRLVIMLILPLHLLITLKDKKRFIISMGLIGLVSVLHILNSYRLGYINMSFDISYLAKTVQLPILAICFTYYIKDEQRKSQAMRGLLIAALITFASIALACLTGTENDTYGPGLGVSGWVIDDNRCANSVILVTLAAALVYFSVKSDSRLINFLVPPLTAFALIANGTKACYYSIFVIYAGFAVFLVAEKLICKRKIKTRMVAILMLVAVISAAVYPITPRCKVSQSQARGADKVQNEIELILGSLGYDLSQMTNEEKLADPVVKKVFGDYYYKVIWCVIPDMFDRFTYDEILLKYDMTTSAEKLINTRLMKRTYAALMWDDCDLLTRLVGFEVSDIWFVGGCDLENDWTALFYYYGYLGFALYAAFTLYFIYLIIKRLCQDFYGAVTEENCLLLLCFALQIGLAEFSGSVIRRPNVSVYMAIIMGLIYYKTKLLPIEGSRSDSGERLGES